MRRALPWVFATAALCAVVPATAATSTKYAIPALPLDQALILFGQQAGVSIGSGDPGIAAATSNALRGRMGLDRALRNLLSRTGYTFTVIDTRTVSITRLSSVNGQVGKARQPLLSPSVLLETESASPEIIVTASKQRQPLANYPGSAHVERIGAIGLTPVNGTAGLTGRLPELGSTNLGPGRNKLFIRGIADSSFSGPTESTVGLYLGELRLTYSAPEPDIQLYDIDSVEIIEGPQGTLYGAGTLGGLIRIVPTPPDMAAIHAKMSAGFAVTDHGRDSYDVGGTINLSVMPDRIALRIVGYGQNLGGYIDNAALGLRDTNRTRVGGMRATLRVNPGDDWQIDLSGLLQNTNTRDGQYAERGLAALTHAAAIAQPHDNDFRGLNVVLTKHWNDLALLSTTGIVHHDLAERFDATGVIGSTEVTAYDRDEHIRLITHETRLSSHRAGDRSWVAGFSYVGNVDRTLQALGVPSAPVPLSLVRNEKSEMAVFGETTVPVSPRWAVTGGSRLVLAHSAGELQSAGAGGERNRKQIRVLPTVAATWRPSDDVQAFARLQSGFRSGGLAVDPGGVVSKFDADEIYTGEVGLRVGKADTKAPSGLSGSIIGSYARWNNIQADLLDARGFPKTANIGAGQVFGVTADIAWRPVDALLIESAVFLNRSELLRLPAGLGGLDGTALPNVPNFGGRMSARVSQPLSDRLTLVLDTTVRYRSGSKVGTVPPLLLEQGEYFEIDTGAAIEAGSWRLTLDATNLINSRSNRFAFGNPFSASLGRQVTPLRPRTVRLGLSIGF